MTSGTSQSGLVVLVGAGPGDKDLVTLAGRRWLSIADVVVYDRLAGAELLHFCRRGAERIFAGKSPGQSTMPQQEINRLLVAKCRAGKLVVRLKGGDPLIFGRGAEEADALRQAGCDFRIVPGVTAASAAGACAAVALTDRRVASTVAFVTGRQSPDADSQAIDWRALAGIQTVVIYMGVARLGWIAERLIEGGKSPQTPLAIIERAYSPSQRVIAATLATAGRKAAESAVEPPAIIIVGAVAAGCSGMSWMDALPLGGKTVMITRRRGQAEPLGEHLRRLGAGVIEAPTIEISAPESFVEVDDALRRLGEFDWLALTSPNGAAAVFERLAALGLDARSLGGVKVAAVGPATAEALRGWGIRADLVAQPHTTEALGKALCSLVADKRRRILLARAQSASPVLAKMLPSAGFDIEQITVYRTLRPAALPSAAVEALRGGRVHWITFTSSSTVENFLAMAPEGVDLANVKLAAIGPVTADAMKARGLDVQVVAHPHTVEALAEAIAAWQVQSV